MMNATVHVQYQSSQKENKDSLVKNKLKSFDILHTVLHVKNSYLLDERAKRAI